MYRRYTNVSREGASPNHIKQVRIRDVIILLLLAGLVFMIIRSIPAFSYQGDEKDVYQRKIIAEFNEANQTVREDLGSYKSGSDEKSLAQIRSNLCAIKTLNDIFLLQQKKVLISGDLVENCIRLIDKYLDDVAKGGLNTTVNLTDLRSGMQQLEDELGQLE